MNEQEDKELETVMERACNNLAKGTFADLDNKTVNWPLLYSEIRNWHATELAQAVAEAQRQAYEYSKAAVIAGPILSSGRRITGTPGSMPQVLDRQIGAHEAGDKTLPVVVNNYVLRDFVLDQINKKLTQLNPQKPGEDTK